MAKSYKVTVFAGTKVVADMAQQVKNATIDASLELKPIAGGATEATAVLLAPPDPLPINSNRKRTKAIGWYKNATGPAWEAPKDSDNTNWWSYETELWSLGSSVPMPVDPDSIKKSQIDVAGGVVSFEKVNNITANSNNYANTLAFVSGSISFTSGNGVSSPNFIRLQYSKIPEYLKGKKITVSGYGPIPAGTALLAFRNAAGIYMPEPSINGKGNDLSPQTTTIPLDADSWANSVSNDASNGGIGTRPKDNPYVFSFMINEGDTALPFQPFGLVLDEQKLKQPDKIVFTNKITETGTGSVPAKEIYPVKKKIDSIMVDTINIMDMTDGSRVFPGYWNLNGGASSSNNWIRSGRKRLPEWVIEKLQNGEDVYMWISGGGPIPTTGSFAIFWDGNNTLTNFIGEGAATYPKKIKLEANWVDYAVTMVNLVGVGLPDNILNNTYTNTFMVSFGDELKPYEPFGGIINPTKLPKSSTLYDEREIVIKKYDSFISHLFFHIGGANDLWFRINLRHQISESKFIDVWRLDEGYIVRRNGDNFSDVQQVVNTGVYENAIYTSGSGYNNALGSAHGWEMLESFEILADSKKLDMQTLSIVKCKMLTFTTKTFFKTPDGSANIGESNKQWIFKDGEFTIRNFVKWLGNLNISVNSYFSMLSVFRKNPAGVQVTHTGMSNDDLTPYDIKDAGFLTPIYSNGKDFRRNTLIAWGDFFKAEMRVIRRQLIKADGTIVVNIPNAGMYVQSDPDEPPYNKFYGRVGSVIVTNGDCIDVETVYKLSNI